MKNKKLKGMTLVECIVALAVMAIMSTTMATAAGSLGVLKVNTNEVIKKNSYQSTLADNKSNAYVTTDDTYQIRLRFGTNTRTYSARKNTTMVKVTAGDGSVSYQAQSGRNYQYYDNIVAP